MPAAVANITQATSTLIKTPFFTMADDKPLSVSFLSPWSEARSEDLVYHYMVLNA